MSDLAEGIKRLRAAYVAFEKGSATVGAERRQMRLYRGMKMLDVGDTFMHERQGGTEIAPMSTTTELEVAVHYGLSPESLLFVLAIDNAVQMGADVQWLGAFPAEAEVRLYSSIFLLAPGPLVCCPWHAYAGTCKHAL